MDEHVLNLLLHEDLPVRFGAVKMMEKAPKEFRDELRVAFQDSSMLVRLAVVEAWSKAPKEFRDELQAAFLDSQNDVRDRALHIWVRNDFGIL